MRWSIDLVVITFLRAGFLQTESADVAADGRAVVASDCENCPSIQSQAAARQLRTYGQMLKRHWEKKLKDGHEHYKLMTYPQQIKYDYYERKKRKAIVKNKAKTQELREYEAAMRLGAQPGGDEANFQNYLKKANQLDEDEDDDAVKLVEAGMDREERRVWKAQDNEAKRQKLEVQEALGEEAIKGMIFDGENMWRDWNSLPDSITEGLKWTPPAAVVEKPYMYWHGSDGILWSNGSRPDMEQLVTTEPHETEELKITAFTPDQIKYGPWACNSKEIRPDKHHHGQRNTLADITGYNGCPRWFGQSLKKRPKFIFGRDAQREPSRIFTNIVSAVLMGLAVGVGVLIAMPHFRRATVSACQEPCLLV